MKSKISSAKFEAYKEMSQSAKNWDHHCSYRLLPHAFEGEHHVIELPHTQLSYSYREGGFMHDAKSPPDSISIAVIQSCCDVACFDRFKLKEGMILFFDDSQSFNFMSKGEVRVAILSIPNTFAEQHTLNFKEILGKYMFDENTHFSTLFDKTRKAFLNFDDSFNFEKVEEMFIDCVRKITETSSVKEAKLTKGEKTALAIRDQVYHHMDGKVNIESFAKQYQVSVQTLENAFKSLFGFTPKKFLQLLKLNLVYHDLQNADPETYTVSKIASKWGFLHMGRFSQDFTKLFGENPSDTLKSLEYIKDNMISTCTSRQEEME
jgi:AraC-like DNA-binding protein